MKKSRPYIIASFILGIAAGLGIAAASFTKDSNKERPFYLQRLFPDGDRLVNPLMQIEVPPGGDQRLEAIKSTVEEYIRTCIVNGSASKVSVYIRDLNKGLWVGINEDENFVAASLVKFPILIAYLKQAERDPAILDRQVKVQYDEKYVNSLKQNIIPSKSVELGKTYTIDELLCNMIAYSDNKAECVLYQNLDLNVFKQVLSDLKLPPDLEKPEHEISAKSYATLFRILYNATYLNKDWSESALRLLVQTDFRDGLVAGLPASVRVAHKFAERAYVMEGSNELVGARQLHDCGIVYYPQNPYLICVMTKGRDQAVLKGIIKHISKTVYERM